jgi:hypothetical protein
VAGNVSAGAATAKVTATSAAQQGLARARVFLTEKPALLLGGAFALGIVIARLV